MTTNNGLPLKGTKLTEAISAAMVERLTGRAVTAFLSANQTNPGVACELFFLEAPPMSEA